MADPGHAELDCRVRREAKPRAVGASIGAKCSEINLHLKIISGEE